MRVDIEKAALLTGAKRGLGCGSAAQLASAAWKRVVLRGSVVALALAGAAPVAAEPPAFKPSAYSDGPVDITTDAYGAFKDAPRAPGLGDVIADFTLPRVDGGTFRLSEELAKREVLLVFYRGHW